jgi:hypothetical protein
MIFYIYNLIQATLSYSSSKIQESYRPSAAKPGLTVVLGNVKPPGYAYFLS